MRVPNIRLDSPDDESADPLDESLMSAFRVHAKARRAFVFLAQLKEENRSDVDEAMIYVACGMSNFQKLKNVHSLKPATLDELRELTQFLGVDAPRHIASLIRRNLVIDVGVGYIVRSTRRWSTLIESLASYKAKRESRQ